MLTCLNCLKNLAYKNKKHELGICDICKSKANSLIGGMFTCNICFSLIKRGINIGSILEIRKIFV